MERDDERVVLEIERINALFDGLPENERKLIEKLIENVSWQSVMLDDLRESIDIDSIVAFDERSGLYKKSAIYEAYATMSNQYTQGVMKLYGLLPDASGPPGGEEAETREVTPLDRARNAARQPEAAV